LIYRYVVLDMQQRGDPAWNSSSAIRKSQKPKVHVSVCEACKRRRSCDDYSRYRQPLLFPDLMAFHAGIEKDENEKALSKACRTG